MQSWPAGWGSTGQQQSSELANHPGSPVLALCFTPLLGVSPCPGERGTWLRDHSAAAALGLEAAVLSIIQIMDSLLKIRTTRRRKVVHQDFEMVFHYCAVTKKLFLEVRILLLTFAGWL